MNKSSTENVKLFAIGGGNPNLNRNCSLKVIKPQKTPVKV
jgi:hypothetical protein